MGVLSGKKAVGVCEVVCNAHLISENPCHFKCISAGHNHRHALDMQHAVSGVSVEGTIITTRDQANQGFYGRALTGKQLLLGGAVSQPTAAKALYAALHDLMDKVEEPLSVAASTR